MSQDLEEHQNIGREKELNDQDAGFLPKLNEISQKFISDLIEERKLLGENFPICAMLIDEAIDRVQSTGRIPGKESNADIYQQKPMKLTQKVSVPVRQYPKFNFTGKILGPKGNSLRRVQDETKCRIAIKGRNSIRNRQKEEELRASGDPRHSHLNKDLFVEISAVATPAECYARIAYALAEMRKYLVPDKNDDVSQEQLRELMNDPELANEHLKKHHIKSYSISRSILDTKVPPSRSGFIKYISMPNKSKAYRHDHYQHTSYEQCPEVEPDEDYEYQHHAITRPPVIYDYGRVQTVVPSSSSVRTIHKRETPSLEYSPEVKRLREVQGYRHSPYHLVKKYEKLYN